MTGPLSIILDTFECAANFVNKTLEHFASGLLIKLVPSCDYIHLGNETKDCVNLKLVECGQITDLVPHQVVNSSLSCQDVSCIENAFKVSCLFELFSGCIKHIL